MGGGNQSWFPAKMAGVAGAAEDAEDAALELGQG
jgi:hypothetical protein